MTERVEVPCADCREPFYRDADKPWRIRCYVCWADWQSTKERQVLDSATAGQQLADLRAELGSNLRGLVQLCHPDRHGDSELATRTTTWLNGLKTRLGL